MSRDLDIDDVVPRAPRGRALDVDEPPVVDEEADAEFSDDDADDDDNGINAVEDPSTLLGTSRTSFGSDAASILNDALGVIGTGLLSGFAAQLGARLAQAVAPRPSPKPALPVPDAPVDKIRKLLKFAREAEASTDTALRREGIVHAKRAEELMRKWNVDVACENDLDVILGERSPFFSQLAFECAASCGCKAARTGGHAGGPLVIRGPERAAKQAATYFRVIVREGREMLTRSPEGKLRGFQEGFWAALTESASKGLPKPQRARSTQPAGAPRRLDPMESLERQRQAIEASTKMIARAIKKRMGYEELPDQEIRREAQTLLGNAYRAGETAGRFAVVKALREQLPDLRLKRPQLCLPPSRLTDTEKRFAELDVD